VDGAGAWRALHLSIDGVGTMSVWVCLKSFPHHVYLLLFSNVPKKKIEASSFRNIRFFAHVQADQTLLHLSTRYQITLHAALKA
jgi:hypothetical protein